MNHSASFQPIYQNVTENVFLLSSNVILTMFLLLVISKEVVNSQEQQQAITLPQGYIICSLVAVFPPVSQWEIPC